MTAGRPFANTRLVSFLKDRIKAFKDIKTQAEIATEAGFRSVNMLAMIQSGRTRLPPDRAQALAIALDVDPARLLLLALEQDEGDTTARAILEIMGGTIASHNETGWIRALRQESDNADPPLTKRARTAIRSLFHKVEPKGSWPHHVLLSEHEAFFIDVIRVASGGTDPSPTLELIQKLRKLFSMEPTGEDGEEDN